MFPRKPVEIRLLLEPPRLICYFLIDSMIIIIIIVRDYVACMIIIAVM